MVGFWSMSAFVYGTAIMGVATIRRGDHAAHRIWMIRFAGSMWGAFWLFRVMLVITGPLLRGYESASILISIWFSAPLGILIAEAFRRRSVRHGCSGGQRDDQQLISSGPACHCWRGSPLPNRSARLTHHHEVVAHSVLVGRPQVGQHTIVESHSERRLADRAVGAPSAGRPHRTRLEYSVVECGLHHQVEQRRRIAAEVVDRAAARRVDDRLAVGGVPPADLDPRPQRRSR